MSLQFRPSATAATRVAAFDARVDGAVGRLLRGHRSVDRVMYGASALGDHGMIWMALAGLQALRRRNDPEARRRAAATVIGLGVESLVVNGPVKWLFRRERPVHDGPRPMHLRQPRSSSFPSGHASSAFFGAALLRDGDPWWPAYYAVAAVVATSRLHVRIHHASDVIGGVVVGAVLGELARRLVEAESPTPRGR